MENAELQKLPFVSRVPTDGRQIRGTAFWDDKTADWITMIETRPGELGRLAGGAPYRAEYYGSVIADATCDVELPLSTLVVEQLSWPAVMKRLRAIESDTHLFCDILEKFEMISQRARTDAGATYLATSELEFLIRVVRSTYDQLQKLIKELAATLVRVDQRNTRLMKGMPNSFADVALRNDNPRTLQEIVSKWEMPTPMAAFYLGEAAFFQRIRAIRNGLEHQGEPVPIAFPLSEGLAVDINEPAWRDLPIWNAVELRNTRLGPMRAVFAYLVAHMLGVFDRFSIMFKASFGLPEPIGDGIQMYMRNPYGRHLASLEDILAAPWNADDAAV